MPRLSKIGAAALAAFGWTGITSVSASYLVVAGGGGGGTGMTSSTVGNGGGGGAGGYLTGTTTLNPTLSYTVVVGAGGAGGVGGVSAGVNSTSGFNSQFGTLTASVGGGAGGNYNGNLPASGGSGGGSGYGNGSGASGTSGQGNAGGTAYTAGVPYGAGGGGGAGAVGGSSSGGGNPTASGGVGLANSITGTSTFYAGGGGSGSGNSSYAGGPGGNGGGGTGGYGTVNATAATANTGGGGGGGGNQGIGGTVSSAGGNGGSGVVIISYAGAQQFGGGVVTSSGGNTIHTFNTSGTLSPLNQLSANYLIVAGGGAGASNLGGGGGGGGMLTGSGVAIDTNSTYIVTVGAGASATYNASVNGSNSSFSAVSTSAVGGGQGSYYNTGSATFIAAGSGGSGGGASNGQPTGASGTSGQGSAGGNSTGSSPNYGAGGGGGAGAVGTTGTATTGGNGGNGLTSSISGTSTYYAGGGGGGVYQAGSSVGTGGLGGGGNAGASNGGNGSSGTSNTGGGGGGASSSGSYSNTGGSGGSGVVIISYAGATQLMAGGTVTISGGNVIHTFTSSGYLTPLKLVNNSLRFRASNSAYLTRTPTVSGSATTWTWSGWVKRGVLSSQGGLQASGNGSNFASGIIFDSSNHLYFYDYISSTFTSSLITTAVYRDPSAWYHFVVVYDTTQATSSNRIRMYVNGVQVTSFGTATYPSQNYASGVFNSSSYAASIGREDGFSNYFDGEITEVNFIDGQALTPNSFGTFNSYGVWQPITYGGSYGTNGFYLPFTNTTSTTTLGYDFSPAGNNWTANNISLTSGSTYDSMTDVPTLTSATVANYCVINPLLRGTGTPGTDFTYKNGNLTFTATAGEQWVGADGSIGVSSGKWYYEAIATSFDATVVFGWVMTQTPRHPGTGAFGAAQSDTGVGFSSDTSVYTQGSGTSLTNSGFTTNDVIGLAIDIGARTMTLYKNGTAIGGASTITSGTYWAGIGGYRNFNINVNFGQQPFVYTPPSGFVALNTYNL
jgi:hypothetical protein